AHLSAEKTPVHIREEFHVVLRQAVKDIRIVVDMAQGKFNESLAEFEKKRREQRAIVNTLRIKWSRAKGKKKDAAKKRLDLAEKVYKEITPKKAVWDDHEIRLFAEIIRKYLILYNDVSLQLLPSLQKAMDAALGQKGVVDIAEVCAEISLEKRLPPETQIVTNTGDYLTSAGLEKWIRSFKHDAHIPAVKYLTNFIQSLFYMSAAGSYEVGDEKMLGGVAE